MDLHTTLQSKAVLRLSAKSSGLLLLARASQQIRAGRSNTHALPIAESGGEVGVDGSTSHDSTASSTATIVRIPSATTLDAQEF